MNENLKDIWILGSGHTLVVLAILQIIDLALTLAHALQERKGRLWRYFGAIAGVKIPDRVGQPLFFGGLTISLWIVGLLGMAGTVLWQTPLAFGCLGAIIGCRVADSWFSHIRLNNAGYRPNPGLPSVPLYLAEALVLLVVFYPSLRMQTFPVLVGFVVGVVAFYAVLPVLKTFGRLLFEPTEPWHRGSPQPEW
ncbi:hypothetical protein [Bradyrhizobium sp.]|uniref:hypothetical protein n=1 Tax=Bradyrhizobium sp. TaxID=376 RepID=UPI002394CC6B|nr:hypothetical protein [Bradyrhizobium sp.]MDE2380427.1 hypothetical protein [Bradyrhizobium sp.]